MAQSTINPDSTRVQRLELELLERDATIRRLAQELFDAQLARKCTFCGTMVTG